MADIKILGEDDFTLIGQAEDDGSKRIEMVLRNHGFLSFTARDGTNYLINSNKITLVKIKP